MSDRKPDAEKPQEKVKKEQEEKAKKQKEEELSPFLTPREGVLGSLRLNLSVMIRFSTALARNILRLKKAAESNDSKLISKLTSQVIRRGEV